MRATFLRLAVLLMLLANVPTPSPALWAKADDAPKSSEAAKPSDTKSADSKPAADKAQVPVFHLKGELIETPRDESFPFNKEKSIALKDLVERLKKAQDDEKVKAVVIALENVSIGWAQIEELRESIAALRAAGKDVYAHADFLPYRHYVLLAGATQINVAPVGDVWLMGLHAESLYARGLLNKLGVTPDFLTCGAYKSAAELFMREGPSPQAEEMMNWLADSLYDTSVKLIARGRGVDPEKVKKWIDDGFYTARRARESGLIDTVQSWEEFQAGITQRFDGNVKFDTKYAEKKEPTMDFSSPMGIFNFYAQLLGGKKLKSHKDSIAVVYVEGPIVLGTLEENPLQPGSAIAASTTIRRALDKAAADDTIKGVVLRVNSPGGSATASEVILAGSQRLKAKKPMVVSMGNVAGSGGYYVACGADTIFADDGTITGSIGVLAGKFATTDMWDKVGIKWKEYDRGVNAALFSSARTFTPQQHKDVQGWMDEIYGVFKDHVTAARGDRLKKPIDEIAGGRVYTGKQALDLGLIDKIGSMADAVQYVADKAKIEKYELRVVPEPKNFLEKIMEDASGQKDDDEVAISANAATGPMRSNLIEAALPYLRNLDPQRTEAVLRAFLQLEILDREGAVLMTPEMVFDSGKK